MSDIENAIIIAKQLIKGQKENKHFDIYAPLYPFNTENSSKVFSTRRDVINGNDVVTVTGSGDAVLDLIYYGANKIHAFDINGLTTYYANLKIAAVKALSYEEYKKFLLCSYSGTIDTKLYNKVLEFLDGDMRTFWDEIFSFINQEHLIMHPSFESNESAKLFYSIQSLFGSANCTINNPYSYMANEVVFCSLKKKLLDRNTSNIMFYNANLFNISDIIDFNRIAYVYFSNIMDFFVGLDKGMVDRDRLIEFKQNIGEVLDNASQGSIVDMCLLKEEGYLFKNELQDYYDVYGQAEGFEFEKLGDKVTVLSFSNGRKMSFHNKI